MTKTVDVKEEDRDLYETIGYQAAKFMDMTVIEQFPALAEGLIKDGHDRIEITTDDVLKLPGGTYLRLRWEIEVMDEDAVKDLAIEIGEYLED